MDMQDAQDKLNKTYSIFSHPVYPVYPCLNLFFLAWPEPQSRTIYRAEASFIKDSVSSVARSQVNDLAQVMASALILAYKSGLASN